MRIIFLLYFKDVKDISMGNVYVMGKRVWKIFPSAWKEDESADESTFHRSIKKKAL